MRCRLCLIMGGSMCRYGGLGGGLDLHVSELMLLLIGRSIGAGESGKSGMSLKWLAIARWIKDVVQK